jgi:hypothetical protein
VGAQEKRLDEHRDRVLIQSNLLDAQEILLGDESNRLGAREKRLDERRDRVLIQSNLLGAQEIFLGDESIFVDAQENLLDRRPVPVLASFPLAMTSAAAPQARVLEFFTLREAEKAVRALPEGPRGTVQRDLALAFQKRDAAETLWPRGSCAEALHLARASLEATGAALDAFAAAAEPKPEWVARAQAHVSAAKEKTLGRALPELEVESRPDDEDTFRTLADAVIAVESEIGAHLAKPEQLARLRRGRIAFAAATVVFLLGFAVWSGRAGPAIKEARASAQNGPDSADRAIDGNAKTNWGLPEGKRGWLDVILTSPRTVKKVRLIAYNSPYNNRFLKDVRVTAFLGEQPVQSMDYTFKAPPAGAEGVWSEIPLNAPKCDRVRIDVISYDGISGAISEIEID